MTRLHIPILRRSTRVTAIRCPICQHWRKPRHIRVPAMVCRDCEHTPAFQTWKTTTTSPAAASAPATAGGAR
jgi:ribosomal protein L37AE/L43A